MVNPATATIKKKEVIALASEEVHRSVRLFAVLCETENGPEDLRSMEQWSDDRVLNATRSPRSGQSITIAALDDSDQITRFNTHGTPMGNVYELIENSLGEEIPEGEK